MYVCGVCFGHSEVSVVGVLRIAYIVTSELTGWAEPSGFALGGERVSVERLGMVFLWSSFLFLLYPIPFLVSTFSLFPVSLLFLIPLVSQQQKGLVSRKEHRGVWETEGKREGGFAR